MTNIEAANLLTDVLNHHSFGRPTSYITAMRMAIDSLNGDAIRAANGEYCVDCAWFHPEGYENNDPEFPELQMGWCSFWRHDTQACNFCGKGCAK